MATNINPSLLQLKRAVELAEEIAALEAELTAVLSGSGEASASAKAPGKRGRKPGRASTKGLASLGFGEMAAEPKKRGRKPGSKNASAEMSEDGAGSLLAAVNKAKRVMSPEARAKIAEAQKRRWAAQKAAE